MNAAIVIVNMFALYAGGINGLWFSIIATVIMVVIVTPFKGGK
jgi:hypothetical protein